MNSAGFFKRILALIYDSLLIAAIIIVASLLLVFINGEYPKPGTLLSFIQFLISILAGPLFYSYFWLTNDGQTTGHGTFSQNDIVGCAVDIDNNKVYFHKNGTYIQSGDPAANSGGQAIPAGFFYGFSVGNETASDSGTMQVNTGNPLFTISSGNADANGFGNFEYAVPSGFFAMCTKNIGEL